MINNIYIIFENCDNIFKTKNNKNNMKKYIRKLLTNIDENKYIEVLDNHIIDYAKYFTVKFKINFKYKNKNITIFINKVTENDILKNKLKSKYRQITNINDLNYKANKEIKLDNKQFKKDDRINNLMINLYFKAKCKMPDSDIPKPNIILDNLDLYKKKFNNYLDIAEKKDDYILKYNLLKNDYCEYMSFITKIPVLISNDLQNKYDKIK